MSMAERFWVPELPAGDFDDDDYVREHFDHYAELLTRGRYSRVANRMREKCPVAHSDVYEDGFMILSRYRDCEAVHHDPVSFSSYSGTIPPFGNPRPSLPWESDPPLHDKYRAIANPFYSRGVQNGKESVYREYVTERIDSFIADGQCDVAQELCVPLALFALMENLGVPESDRPHLREIAYRLIHKEGEVNAEEGSTELVNTAVQDLYAYFTELIRLKREEPGHDVISVLCNATIDDTPLATEEIIDFAMILVPAGFETTASVMGYMFLLLAENPEIAHRLRDDPSLIPGAIEEIMRYVTPVKGLSRTVKSDVEVAGHQFERGDRLILHWAAANRDPEAFDNPDELIIDRKPNRHMGFGLGTHLCLGIHMARLEMKVAFEESLRRLDNIAIPDVSKIVEQPGTTFGIVNLPISFTARGE